MKNQKSDVNAKSAYVDYLKSNGFEASVKSTPADIIATKDGQTWYFEIKMTKRQDVYFGAATLTEWQQAIKDPDHFRFVVVKTNEAETEFEFIEYTPAEFMEFSTIPPFKIFFNINLDGPSRIKRGGKAVKMTAEKLVMINKCYEELKRG